MFSFRCECLLLLYRVVLLLHVCCVIQELSNGGRWYLFRVTIQELATAVEVYNRRLIVDELFQLAASTTPSATGSLQYGWMTGILMYDHYLKVYRC